MWAGYEKGREGGEARGGKGRRGVEEGKGGEGVGAPSSSCGTDWNEERAELLRA